MYGRNQYIVINKGDNCIGQVDVGQIVIGQLRYLLYFHLTILASVKANKPWTQTMLDELEGRLQKQLMTMDYNGGINLRDETHRKRRHGN